MGEGGVRSFSFLYSAKVCIYACISGNYMNPVQIEYLVKFVKFAKGLANAMIFFTDYLSLKKKTVDVEVEYC